MELAAFIFCHPEHSEGSYALNALLNKIIHVVTHDKHKVPSLRYATGGEAITCLQSGLVYWGLLRYARNDAVFSICHFTLKVPRILKLRMTKRS